MATSSLYLLFHSCAALILEPDLPASPPSAQVLSTDSVERLPVFNMSALRHYKLSLEADDWCVPSKEPLNLANYRAEK